MVDEACTYRVLALWPIKSVSVSFSDNARKTAKAYLRKGRVQQFKAGRERDSVEFSDVVLKDFVQKILGEAIKTLGMKKTRE